MADDPSEKFQPPALSRYAGLKARGERGEDTSTVTNIVELGFYQGFIAMVLPASDVGPACAYLMSAPQARTFSTKLASMADRLDAKMPTAQDMDFHL